LKRLLLCTDLDRTIIPNGVQLESPDAKERFDQLTNLKNVTLAYVTGRDLELVKQAVADFELQLPDFIIADVGTSIYQLVNSGWQRWRNWDEQIASDWGGADIYNLLSAFPELHLQEKEKLGRYKLSFYVSLSVNVEALISQIDSQLKYAGIRANSIWSIDEQKGVGLLDVLPASASKLSAIQFMMQHQKFDCKNTFFAGDSGNDLDVLRSEILAILVANSTEEIKDQLAHISPDNLYIAKGAYLGMNGNYRGGILEGLAYYLPEVDMWMQETKLSKGN